MDCVALLGKVTYIAGEAQVPQTLRLVKGECAERTILIQRFLKVVLYLHRLPLPARSYVSKQIESANAARFLTQNLSATYPIYSLLNLAFS